MTTCRDSKRFDSGLPSGSGITQFDDGRAALHTPPMRNDADRCRPAGDTITRSRAIAGTHADSPVDRSGMRYAGAQTAGFVVPCPSSATPRFSPVLSLARRRQGAKRTPRGAHETNALRNRSQKPALRRHCPNTSLPRYTATAKTPISVPWRHGARPTIPELPVRVIGGRGFRVLPGRDRLKEWPAFVLVSAKIAGSVENW